MLHQLVTRLGSMGTDRPMYIETKDQGLCGTLLSFMMNIELSIIA
jgi:hypothetical protein